MRRRRFDAGLWLLQRQRLHIADPEPPPPYAVQPIGPTVAEFARRIGRHGDLWRQVLQGEWAAIVGDSLAQRTRPGELRGDTLIVYVRHAIFLHELARDRAAAARLIANIRERCPDAPIRAVRFQADPGEHPSASESSPAKGSPPQKK